MLILLKSKYLQKAFANFICIIDSASVGISSISGHQRGVGGNKKIKGSKRDIIVDTMGLIICLSVHAANIHNSKGAKEG